MIFVPASMVPCPSSNDGLDGASLPRRGRRKLAGGKASETSDTPGSSVQKIMHPGGVPEAFGGFERRRIFRHHACSSQKFRILRRGKANDFRAEQLLRIDARQARIRKADENPVPARTDAQRVWIRHRDRISTVAANAKRHKWPGIPQFAQTFDFHAAHENAERPSVQVPAPLRGADRFPADPGVLPPANLRQASGLIAHKPEAPTQTNF